MIKAIIFDVDGTLLDSVNQHAAAWQEALRHFGKETDFDYVKKQIGKGDDHLLPLFFTASELEPLKKDIVQYRSSLFKSQYLPQIKPFPRVRSLFERVHGDGLRIVLASSASAEDLQVYQEIANIADLVERQASKNDAAHSKPNPDIFAAALDHLKTVLPDEAVAVGDTPWDALAAGALGISTVGVLSGGWTTDELRKAGCCATYQDVGHLLGRYDGSPLKTCTAPSA